MWFRAFQLVGVKWEYLCFPQCYCRTPAVIYSSHALDCEATGPRRSQAFKFRSASLALGRASLITARNHQRRAGETVPDAAVVAFALALLDCGHERRRLAAAS